MLTDAHGLAHALWQLDTRSAATALGIRTWFAKTSFQRRAEAVLVAREI
jgi:hypothetical protein